MQPNSPSEEKKKGHKVTPLEPTMGQTLHNELTYRLVNWVENSSVGVGFTYWTQRTESGKRIFTDFFTGLYSKLLKPIIKDPKRLTDSAKGGTMLTSIAIGGTFIIPQMMLLENKSNKKAIVKKFDEMVYGKEEVASNPRFAKAYATIDEEPDKDFSTGMASRVVTLAPLLAVCLSPLHQPLQKVVYNPIGKATKLVAESVGIKPTKLIKRTMLESNGGAESLVSDWDFIHNTIGFDFGLTFLYSFMHEAAYKLGAAMRYGEKETKEAVTAHVAHHDEHEQKEEEQRSSFASKHAPRNHKIEEREGFLQRVKAADSSFSLSP